MLTHVIDEFLYTFLGTGILKNARFSKIWSTNLENLQKRIKYWLTQLKYGREKEEKKINNYYYSRIGDQGRITH